MPRSHLRFVCAFCLMLVLSVFGPSAFGQASPPPRNVMFLVISWTNPASGPVPVVVVDPNGKTINEADFAANNMAVVPQLTTAYQKTVAILNPVKSAGWTARVNTSSNLGPITVLVKPADASPQLKSVSVVGVANNNSLSVQYDTSGVGGGATIMIFADQSGKGYNGLPLGQAKVTGDGTATVEVKTTSLSNGTWYVYGMLMSNAPPQMMYARSVVTAQDGKVTVQQAQ